LLRSVELFDGEGSGAFPQNPQIDSLAVAGSVAWLLGRSATAVDRVSQAWKEAHDLNLPFDIAFVGPWICSVLIWCGEFHSALEKAEEMLRISTEHHFPQFVALAQMYKGSALSALGNSGEGLALVRQGLDGNFALGRRLALPELLTWLAEAQMRAGILHNSASTLDDALNAASTELYWRPETLRLRGEVSLMLGRSGATSEPGLAMENRAEQDFLDARSLARKIGARSLELRAATSLARWSLTRGDHRRAQELLGPLLGEFDEGETTPDVSHALELLAKSRELLRLF
jgi:tetratricopeptide (TPR) repeat protein